MKARRFLAGLLCAALIFSSEAFTMGVMASEVPAAEQTDEMVVEADDTLVVDETEAPAEESTEAPAEEPEATAEPTAEPTEAPAEEIPEVTAEPTEAPAEEPEVTIEPTAEPTEVPTEEPEVTSEPTEAPTEEPEATEEPAANETDVPVEESPEMSEEATEEATETPDVGIDIGIVQGSEEFFYVDDDGVLQMIPEKEMYGSTIVVPKEAKTIPNNIFVEKTSVKYVKFEVGSELTNIESGAFEGSGIVEITLPEGVTVIKEDTFKNSYLEKITFLGAVSTIEKEAFADTPLKEIEANDVTSVGNNAFANCSSLKNVKMPKLETIGSRAFQYCSSLNTGMIWSAKLTTIGKEAFKGCGFVSIDFSTVGSEQLVLEARVFESCTKLENVVFPASMNVVPGATFKDCKALKSVNLDPAKNGGNITAIYEDAFNGCESLARIIIPASVSKIYADAFEGCSALTEIIFLNSNPNGDDFWIVQNAFPNLNNNNQVTMKGYNGKVQEYAIAKGYKFATLYPSYAIEFYPSNYGTMTINKNPAIPGDEILVKVTPKEGYYLDSDGLIATCDNSIVEPEFMKNEEGVQTFRFEMPAGKVILKAEYVEVESVKGNKMAVEFSAVSGCNYEPTEKMLIIDKAGLEIVTSVKMDGKVVGPWMLDFSSDKESVAIISDTGKISTKQKGKAVITAALKTDASKKISFTVNVKENVFISDMTLLIRKPENGTVKSEVIDGKTYKVVEYLKTSLAKEGKQIGISVTAKEEGEDANLMVEMAWKSTNSKIANPLNAISTDNTNTVLVKKGAEGETMITVKVTNKDVNKTVCQESIIIRVIDATPRLADRKVSVNSLSTVGTVIDIVPVYGYEIINNGEDLQICQKKVSKGIISYPVLKGLEISKSPEDGKYRVIATEELKIKSGETLAYAGDKQLYIKGEFEFTGDEFVIPIPELNVTKKAVSPTVKLTGKINLFYNTKASETELGKVKVTQNLKTENVLYYELVSEKNYKKAGSEETDSFAANFNISAPDEDGTAYITRTDSEMVQVGGKNVTTGYLYIYYAGYSTPIKKKITVPIQNTAPKYVLSKTSATASKYRNEQEYRLNLLDAKTKAVVDLTENDTLSFNDLKTTENLFDRTVLDSEIEDDVILLKVEDAPRKGKVVVIVKKESWTKSLQYTFVLSVTASHPKVKFTPASVTLNMLCPDEAATLTGSIVSQDAFFTGFDEVTLRFAGGKSQRKEAQKLLDMMEVDGANITVSLPEGGVKKGTYQFKIMPTIEYYGSGKAFTVSEVAFKVVVKNDTPTVALKKTTVTMNTLYAGKEESAIGFSISNLPAGSDYVLNADAQNILLTPLKSTNSNAQYMRDKITLDFDQASGKVTVALAEDALDKFDFQYYVSGLSVTIGEETVPLSKFKIRVIGKKLTPKMTVKASGALNTVDSDSKITYTMTVSNVNSAIADVKIWEHESNGSYYYDGEGTAEENRTSKHFEGVLEGNKFVIRAKEGATLKAGTTYKIRLAYALEVSDEEYATSAILSVKPTQTMPKIKTDKSAAYLYAGQNRPKDVVVKITPTTVKTAEIIDVKFAKGTSEEVKKAYKISYDEDTQELTLTLINPAVLILNKEYEMKFEIVCANQMANTVGTVFKLKMTVRK